MASKDVISGHKDQELRPLRVELVPMTKKERQERTKSIYMRVKKT